MKITAIVKKSPMTWHNQILNNLEAATQSEEGLGGFHVQLPPKPTGQPCWWKFTFERNASNANVVPQLQGGNKEKPWKTLGGDRWIHEDPRIPKINHWVIYLDSCLYLSMWSHTWFWDECPFLGVASGDYNDYKYTRCWPWSKSGTLSESWFSRSHSV